MKEHGNKYQNPILTCENTKPLVWKNNIPFLPEHENQGAKLENQNRRFLSWHRSNFPKKIILPTSTILAEIAFRNNKTSQRIKYRRMRKKLLEKPEFLMMFCEHHGLDYDDFSTNNAPLPPPLLDPG